MSDLKRFEHLKIQLGALILATNNFAENHCIGKGGFGKVYKGELAHLEGHTTVAVKCLDRAFGQGEREFWNEILMLSLYKHENIVPLLGGLDLYLNSKDLSWVRRLKICIGAARGLAYLNEPAVTQQRLLHRDIKSSNILLNENWNALIADFGLSKFGPANFQYSLLFSNPVGTFGYSDPLYIETGLLTKESDAYSFGVVLFEVLCGRLCNDKNDKSRSFTELVRNHYKQNNLNDIIFQNIKDEVNAHSLKAFSTIAYQCLKRARDKRPLMKEILAALETALEYQNEPGFLPDSSLPKRMSISNKSEHLEIKLTDIISATSNFAEANCIGKGRFGTVYKGELLHSKGYTMVALKRLNRKSTQGEYEFWKEIILFSVYKHVNIISLLGVCDERGEKVLVYEYAYKRSLDLHLDNNDLTWIRRLKICIGVARGLAYLHNLFGTHQTVLHRDIKSSNILLDDNWNAKITDFGLSEFGPTSQQYPFLVGDVVGTHGYCDPLYVKSGRLTKQSDVYTFGVVLFEVLCGRLCMAKNDMPQQFTELVRKCYEQNNLNEVIFSSIKDQINPSSLKAFATIAYQCLNINEGRPVMTKIVKILETALKYQES